MTVTRAPTKAPQGLQVKLATLFATAAMLGAMFGGGTAAAAPAETPASWDPPTLLESNDLGAAYSPRVAIGPSGKAAVVWAQSNGTNERPWMTLREPGGAWTAPIPVGDEAHVDGSSPLVALADDVHVWWDQSAPGGTKLTRSQYRSGLGWQPLESPDNRFGYPMDLRIVGTGGGNLTAVWVSWRSHTQSIMTSRFEPGAGWGEAQPLYEAMSDTFPSVDAAADGLGNVFAVWSFNESGTHYLRSSRFVPGYGWSPPYNLDDGSAGRPSGPDIAADAGGNAVAVWTRHAFTSSTSIVVARFDLAEGWSSPRVVEAGVGGARSPKIAMDPAGNAWAIWNRTLDGQIDVVAANYTQSSGWGSPVPLESLQGPADHPLIGAEAAGNFLAIWRQADAGRTSIWAARCTPGGAWSAPAMLDPLGGGNAYDPDLAVAADGSALAAWEQDDGEAISIRSSSFDASSGWRAAEWLEFQNAGFARRPLVASDAHGNAVAIWEQAYDRFYFRIWASEFTPATGWSAAHMIPGFFAGGYYDAAPALKMNSRGQAAAVWAEFGPGPYGMALFLRQYTVGVGWGPKFQLSSPKDDPQGQSANGFARVSLDIDDSGAMYVAWDEHRGTGRTMARAFQPASGWGDVVTLSGAVGYHHGFGAQVAAAGQGKAIAAWVRDEDNNYSIVVSRFDAGSGWGPSVTVLENVSFRNFPSLAADVFGAAAISWFSYPSSYPRPHQLHVGTLAAGSSRMTVEDLETGDVAGGMHPLLQSAPDGSVVVGWLEAINYSSTSFWVRERSAQGPWSEPFLVASAPEGGWIYPASFGLAPTHRASAIWMEHTNTTESFYVRRMAPNSTWSDPEPIATGLRGTVGEMAVAMDGLGNLFAAWTQGDPVKSAYAARSTREAPCAGLDVHSFTGPIVNTSNVRFEGTSFAGSTITLNGNAAAVDALGRFSGVLVLADGVHSLLTRAEAADGRACEARLVVRVDTVAPPLEILSPRDGSITPADEIWVEGVTEPWARVTVAGLEMVAAANGSFGAMVPLAPGTNALAVISIDEAGNAAQVAVNVTRESQNPTFVPGLGGGAALVALAAAVGSRLGRRRGKSR